MTLALILVTALVALVWLIGIVAALVKRWPVGPALVWPIVLLAIKLFGGRPQ